MFRSGDDVGRAWDEAEAILLACEDIEAVMATIRDAGSPVEARRALKARHGFTGRQAAVLLTLPVLSFTRSERERLDESRRARMALLADVTGAIPAVREPAAEIFPETGPEAGAASGPESFQGTAPVAFVAESHPAASTVGRPGQADRDERADWNVWESEFDGTLDRIQSVMDEHYGVAPGEATKATEAADSPGLPAPSSPLSAPSPTPPTPPPSSTPPPSPSSAPERSVAPSRSRSGRRSSRGEPEVAADVIDEQIGELCVAIAEFLRVAPPVSPSLDDPREATSPTGQLLGSCGVDDATGVRTLLWHLRRTGLESVEALLPFAEPLPGARGFDIQSAQFEAAMVAGALGAEPGGTASWTGRLWPIADRRGFGYAVHYRPGPGSGAVWAYGGGEPLHHLWDSVVDMLVELYQSLTAGEPIDGALGTVVDGRVVWTNLA